MLWHVKTTDDHLVGNLGQGMYWRASDKTHQPDAPTGLGASVDGSMPRGCPMPVLKGGHALLLE